ncbi:hypothetical protein BGZ81_003979 [Podila clonocystis]|nr:hypothetical protein BGZ81_003979 [Podila clonocystis]
MSVADTNSVSHFYYYDDDFGSESDLSISSHSDHFTLPWLTKERSNTDDTDNTDNNNDGRPKVLIVGAGIGGLALGILLLKAGIPFQIFERNSDIKPLGSGIAIGATFRGLFEQLGILEEFKALGKPMIGMDVFSEDCKKLFHVDGTERARLCGTNEYIVSRPEFYNLLLKQIPPEYIHMGKKVLWFNQDEDGVTIRTWDKKYHHGDILVGADGSYSAVRQNMYKSLKDKGSLPPSDDTSLPFDYVCLLGQTEVLNQEDFPELNKPYSKFNSILGIDRAYACVTMTTAQNSICWVLLQSLNKVSAKANDSFRASELGPEAAQAMCKEVRNFKIPGGRDSKDLTLGVLIDKTPKELISKVMLEEKLFDTWHAGRTVLLGDACHKLNPAGGAGAMTAIQDAVALANWISTLQAATLPDIEAIFKEYKAERYPVAKQAVATTQLFKGLGEKLVQDCYISDFTGRTARLYVWPYPYGDYIDELMSKVMLIAGKIFHIWHGGRTVHLCGACHKLNAASLTATHDAIANWICAVQARVTTDIEAVFKEYRAERLPIAKEAFENSRMFDNVGGKGYDEELCPRVLWRMLLIKMTENSGQATFLPLVKDKGRSKPKYGASYYKTLELQRRKPAVINEQNSGSPPPLLFDHE